MPNCNYIGGGAHHINQRGGVRSLFHVNVHAIDGPYLFLDQIVLLNYDTWYSVLYSYTVRSLRLL